jgi:hypothetical protein
MDETNRCDYIVQAYNCGKVASMSLRKPPRWSDRNLKSPSRRSHRLSDICSCLIKKWMPR